MRERQDASACSENPRLPFTRSLSDILYRDHLATLDGIRQLYIPRHSPNELVDFPQALEWARENLEVFQEAGFGINGVGLNDLPEIVRSHLSCIGFLLISEEQLLGMPTAQTNAPVTYNPVTPEWKRYVQHMLSPHFERYTKWLLETGHWTPDDLKASASGRYSTTRHLALMKISFDSGWEERRREASDILTGELWLRYWVTLQRRSESCINRLG